jgi:hypothetical protein
VSIGTESKRRPRARAAGLAALLLLLTSCTTPLPDLSSTRAAPTPPEQWSTAYRSALRQSLFSVRRFYDEHAVLDLTALGRGRATERDEDVRLLRATFDVLDADAAGDTTGELYLARSGAIQQSSFMNQAFQAPHQLVSIDEMSVTGIVRETFAVSELAWRSARADDQRILAAHKLALAWAAAWRESNAQRIPALYRADATLDDELVGTTASSGSAIASLVANRAASVALPHLAITTMPDLGGPAVFVVGSTEWSYQPPMARVVVIGSANDGAACPGGVATVLDLDAKGRIAHEQRYHRAADLTRCGVAGPAPAGWWDDTPIPAPVAVDPTGTLDLGGQKVAMFNSTKGLDGLVTWALGRFLEAKLEAPRVSRVTYLEPTVDACRDVPGIGGVSGLAVGDQLTMCFTQAMVCANDACTSYQPAAKAVMLHELGHAWMSTHTKRRPGEAFTEQAGLPRWASTDVPWGQRGVELAADVIAWGLMDTPRPVSAKFPEYSCDELAALFETLTDSTAPSAQRCTQEAASASGADGSG